MKLIHYFLIVTSLTTACFTVQAQDFSENDHRWLREWTNFNPNKANYPEAEEKLPNIITNNTYLRNDVVYLLSGNVYVIGRSTLTIQKGTIIRCDHENPANLIIAKGSKLIAEGSEAYPIVFTSNKSAKSRTSGDWGGIIIAGSGKVNTTSGNGVIKGDLIPQHTTYGGNQYNEQTAILRYVRIEFPGNKTKGNHAANGLSLYGAGKNTILENVMVSYSGQDSFSWHGGNQTIKNLVSLKAEDDDFEISEGFKGDLDNIIAIRHPYITSTNGSYAIEINGYDKKSGFIKPNAITDASITNASLINLSDKSNYQHTTSAISVLNLATMYIHNSKISGFSNVVKFDKSYTSLASIEKAFRMDNSFFNIHGEGVEVNHKLNAEVIDILKYNRFTKSFVSVADLFKDPHSEMIPKFQLKQSLNNYMVMQ